MSRRHVREFMKTFIAFTCVLLVCVPALSEGVTALRQNCVACHGAIKDGKKTVKGNFDITRLLQHGIQDRHSRDWVTVVKQLREKEMPPTDSKYKLREAQRMAVIASVYAKLDRGEIRERLLTPFEIANTYAKVFGFDREIYDPFEKLYFLENIDSAYPTIDSPSLMSAAYLREIENGLDLALDYTAANGFKRIGGISKKYRDVKQFELRFTRTRVSMDRTGVAYHAYITPPTLPVSSDVLKNTTDDAKRRRMKEINAKAVRDHLEHIKETKNLDLLDLRMRGSNRLSCKQYGTNLPVGRYRLKFTASALNRGLVNQVVESKMKGKKGVGSFRELHGAKAGLAIRHGGINVSRRGRLAAHSKKGKLLHYFKIEDNEKREYVCEFDLVIPGQIEMDFVNGPWSSRLNRLTLGNENGKARDPDKYRLPCIRIYSKILLERIAEPAATSLYQLASDSAPSERKKNLIRLTSNLSLGAQAAALTSVHERLGPALGIEKGYIQALKWIAMSPQQLYIQYDSKDPIASARFVSYAFLKKHPSEPFKTDYKRFRAGDLSAGDLAVKIVSDPGFDDFLDIFAKHWLENRTVLDEKKFAKEDLALPFKSETRQYLKFLFSRNKPALDLVTSDYRMLAGPMASFYGMALDGLDRHTPKLIKTPGKGGLIHQANFFVARSDGVDPRPFRRAAWIVENAFGHHLSEPPGNINADQFVASAKTTTFEDRVKIHSVNKACIGCHNKLDPIAFALNDYDTIGRMTGEPNAEAKQRLATRLKGAGATVARSFTRNLVAFTVGRNNNIHDMKTVDAILIKTAKDGYRVRDILAEILKLYFRT